MNAMLLAALGSSLLPQPALFAQSAASKPGPFRVNIPQGTIDRILTRVLEAEWPDRLDAPDLRYGVSWDEAGGVISAAATRLGVPRTTLNAMMRKLGISRNDL